ncbi:MAG: hypothetical protein MK142_01415, partial [Pseudomonadales bacterium]|nr:hypothetical protein [Pseudomonadales bacterium]
RSLTVLPLDAAATRSFIADALNSDESDVEALATEIHARANGRPSRVLDALDALWRTGRLAYDRPGGRWRLHATEGPEPSTDLGDETAQLLTLASVFGSDFHIGDLAQVADLPQEQVLARLAPATQALIIEPARAAHLATASALASGAHPPLAMTFVDEAVRARYVEGIEAAALADLHARIADRLLATGNHRLRDAVGHLEVATRMRSATTPAPDRLASLCLAAGQQAMADREPRGAFRVLRSGLAMLGPHPWRRHPEAARALTQAAMEAAMRCGDVQQVERLGQAALQETTVSATRMHLTLMIIQAKRLSGDTVASEALARQALTAIGAGPAAPNPTRNLLRVMLGGRKLLARLTREANAREALPPADEADRLAAVLHTHLLQGSTRDERGHMLAVLVPALALVQRAPGVDALPVVLATLAATHMNLGQRRAAARYRQAAERRIALDGPTSALPLRARLVLEIFVRPWFEPAGRCLDELEVLRDDARAAGDIECASYAAAGYAVTSLIRGAPREPLLQELEHLDRSLRMFRNAPGLRLLSLYRAHLKGSEPDEHDVLEANAEGLRAQTAALAAWRAMERGNSTSALALLEPIMDTAFVARGGLFSTQIHLMRGLAALDVSEARGLNAARAARRAVRAQVCKGLEEAAAKALILEGEIR